MIPEDRDRDDLEDLDCDDPKELGRDDLENLDCDDPKDLDRDDLEYLDCDDPHDDLPEDLDRDNSLENLDRDDLGDLSMGEILLDKKAANEVGGRGRESDDREVVLKFVWGERGAREKKRVSYPCYWGQTRTK